MKAAPGAASWIAAGVRNELLIRALPALRHDLAGPVSVMRMALLLLERQAGSPSATPEALTQHVAVLGEQVDALAQGLRLLRNWELPAGDEAIARSTLVTQCVALMRGAFELDGIALQAHDALAPRDGEPLFVDAAALRYMVLGVLGHLHDAPAPLRAVRIEADGVAALRFVAERGDPDAGDAVIASVRAPRRLAIDAVALQALADGLGYPVQVTPQAVRLGLGR